VTREEGCHRFDVCLGADGEVFLYELYADAAAFDLHLRSAHFRDFDRIACEMIKEKSIKTYDLAHRGGLSS